MGKITRKKKQLNYKPIIYVAIAAIPVLVAITILIRPARIVPLKFSEEPAFGTRLSKSGTFHIRWKTNQPASCIVYYRFGSSGRFQEMSTAYGDRFVVAIPAKAGNIIEFYIKVNAARQEIVSEKYRVKLKPYVPLSTTFAPKQKAGKKEKR